MLAGATVIAVLVSLWSSYRPVRSAPQENVAVILARVAVSIGRALHAGGGRARHAHRRHLRHLRGRGVLFFALGSLRLGKIVRFIPYPVIGGFLAGAG